MPELLQNDANPQTIEDNILKLLENPALYNDIKNQLLEVKNALGEKGVNDKIARFLLDSK